MKKVITALCWAASASLVLLAGCGSLAAFLIPDQKVNDPLKLNDVHLSTFVDSSGVLSVGTRTSDPFPNLGSAPANPKSFTIDQPLNPAVYITGPAPSYPASVTLSNVTMTLTATDENGQTVTLPPAVISTPITLTQSSGSKYLMTGGPFSFHIDPGSQSGPLLSLLTSGGTNVVSATVTLHVDTPGFPTNTQFQLLFDPGVGTAKF